MRNMISLKTRLIFVMFLALVLSIIPLPEWFTAIRPAWMLLLFLYVEFYLPNSFRVTRIVLAGLCLDILFASVIGEHAFALVVTTWIASRKIRRFHFYTVVQQIFLIGLFSLIYQTILSLIDAFLGYHYSFAMATGSILLTMLVWPWTKQVLDGILKGKSFWLYTQDTST